jgi:asparagine synthase (glutamine-hydrolysing)
MCGICGFIGVAVAKNREIETMMNSIRHRGPDGSGYWISERVALGHLRLSIIDLSDAGRQPMVDPLTGNQLIFNGEIYNYLELKKELQKDYQFITQTDTEVILAAFRKWGIDCLKKLRGMFALAIYNAAERTLNVARDRVGIKPFYYRLANNRFYFSSEIKTLVHSAIGKRSVNVLRASEFLMARQLDTTDQTLFEDVQQLKPGHWMKIDEQGQCGSQKAYWDFPVPGTITFSKRHQMELVERMDETIRLHLRSDVPVGSFVSGGIDSSAVTCFALRHLEKDQSLHTYSALLPKANAENALIPYINTLPKVEKHEFMLDGRDFFNDIRKVIYHHDEPLLDGSMYSHFKLCEMAQADGIKVLLSGAGGDELFGGYFSHVSSYLGSLIQQLKWKKLYNSVNEISSKSDYSRAQLLVKAAQETLPFSLRKLLKNNSIKKQFTHFRAQSDLAFFTQTNANAWTANLLNNYKSWTVPPYLHYEDRNSMAFGVEIRVPFYDHVLMEWVMQFDPGSFINGSSKSMMRESFKQIVPSEILQQKGKYGFPSPIDELLRVSKESKELYYDLVPANPFFVSSNAKDLGDRFFSGREEVGTFWRALSFSLWYSLFFTSDR